MLGKKKIPSSGRFRSVDLGVAIDKYEPHMLPLHHRAITMRGFREDANTTQMQDISASMTPQHQSVRATAVQAAYQVP